MQVNVTGRLVIVALVVLTLAGIGSVVAITGDDAESRIGIIVVLLGPILAQLVLLLRQEKVEQQVDKIEAAVNGPASDERGLAGAERVRVQERDAEQDAGGIPPPPLPPRHGG